MNTKHKAPNHSNKIGEYTKLKAELEISLNREVNKLPDDIGVKKVDSIINKLNQIDGVLEERDEMSKNKYSENTIALGGGFYEVYF